MSLAVHWFRRDLRIADNTALYNALSSGKSVLAVFIFDETILKSLPKNDARVNYIYQNLFKIDIWLKKRGSSLLCLKGNPEDAWQTIISRYPVSDVFLNKDYEPYARERDQKIKTFLLGKGIGFHTYKDQVIFEENEIEKADLSPYTMFTPYKNKWLEHYNKTRIDINHIPIESSFHQFSARFPSIEAVGFEKTGIIIPDYKIPSPDTYENERNMPALESGSHLSPHLRFGTVSIRVIVSQLTPQHGTFLNELIWREFFMQILYRFPNSVKQNFRPKYNLMEWSNNEIDFKRWTEGTTGYPLIDAGMRQLNQTGFIHNRVRMVCASFLCKHLLIDWLWGEAYFAEKLIDYELSSNNGNWQWAAGTGCDAAPYFRIFNPVQQQKKFDPDLTYIRKYIPEIYTSEYPKPMIDHAFARNRAINAYKNIKPD